MGDPPINDEPIKVLVVEDNEDIRFLLTTVFGLAKDIVITAESHDANHALEEWRAHSPDMVILDYWLPGGNGIDLARSMRAERADQPIILFSAFLDKDVVAAAEDAGVVECLSKEQARQLPEIIRRAVGR